MFIVEERSFGAVLAALALAMLIGIGAQMFVPTPSAQSGPTPAAQQRLATQGSAPELHRVVALTLWRG